MSNFRVVKRGKGTEEFEYFDAAKRSLIDFDGDFARLVDIERNCVIMINHKGELFHAEAQNTIRKYVPKDSYTKLGEAFASVYPQINEIAFDPFLWWRENETFEVMIVYLSSVLTHDDFETLLYSVYAEIFEPIQKYMSIADVEFVASIFKAAMPQIHNDIGLTTFLTMLINITKLITELKTDENIELSRHIADAIRKHYPTLTSTFVKAE